MARIAVSTFGCKANQADSASLKDGIAAHLPDAVFVGSDEPADLVLVNTCTVTHTADADARQVIRRLKGANPEARIVVTGCYAQTDRDALAAMPEVDHVVGNIHKSRIPELVTSVLVGNKATLEAARVGNREWNPTLRDAASIRTLQRGRSRPFLKVQDGCDYVCSFCIIPQARGNSRSLSMDHVVDECRTYEQLGAQEVVLTGIHLGHWGRDLRPKRRFGDMVEELIARTESVRFRISSLEPNEVDSHVLDLVANHPRVCRHLHVPLQSGDDAVLSRMRRVYRTSWYEKIMSRFHEALPLGAWGIDVMVGFPGETDTEFENTVRFLESIPFTYLHVFPYSVRRNTVAATMPDQVTPQIKKARVQRLLRLSNRRKQQHIDASVGQLGDVLLEERRYKGKLRGYTEAYVPVLVDGPDEWMGTLRTIALRDSVPGYALGTEG